MRLVSLIPLLALCVCTEAAAQIWQLPRESGHVGDHFGTAVAIDGGRALVGASGEDVCGENSGAVYVYEGLRPGLHQKETRLQPARCEAGRFFGRAVALSRNIAAIAAGGEAIDFGRPNSVHVFVRHQEGEWIEEAVITPPGRTPSAGFASAISLSNERLMIAQRGEAGSAASTGMAYVYERDGDQWALTAELRPAEPQAHRTFGADVVGDGDQIVVTAPAEYTPGGGSVYVFEKFDGGWSQTGRLDGFYGPILRAALSGSMLVVGEPGARPDATGAASVFVRRQTGGWNRVATLRADVPYAHGAFGSVVSADRSASGFRILVVGYTEQLGRGINIDRVVHAFGYDNEAGWRQRQTIDLGDWGFAMDIDISGDTALIGRASDDAPGAAYIVRLLK